MKMIFFLRRFFKNQTFFLLNFKNSRFDLFFHYDNVFPTFGFKCFLISGGYPPGGDIMRVKETYLFIINILLFIVVFILLFK